MYSKGVICSTQGTEEKTMVLNGLSGPLYLQNPQSVGDFKWILVGPGFELSIDAILANGPLHRKIHRHSHVYI